MQTPQGMDEIASIAAQMTGDLSGILPVQVSVPMPMGGPVAVVPWTKEQDEVLREGVLRYGTISWEKIAQHMGNYGRTPQCCSDRWEIVKAQPVKVQCP